MKKIKIFYTFTNKMSLPRYTNSTPNAPNIPNIQITLPATINTDFSSFVNGYTPPSAIDTAGIPPANVPYFTQALTNLYHTVWIPKTPHTEPAYGSGNIQLVKVYRLGPNYQVEVYGARQATIAYQVQNPTISYTASTMTMVGTNGRILTFNKSGDTYTFDGGNTVEIWQLTLQNTILNTIMFRYHVVLLTL